MRSIVRGSTKVLGIAIALGLVLGIAQTAYAAADGIGEPTQGQCTIKIGDWDHDTYDQVSLMTAMYMANNSDIYDTGCSDGIILDVPVTITSPIIIATEKNFVLDGNDQLIRVKNLKKKTDKMSGTVNDVPCAIYVKKGSGNRVEIKNLNIEAHADDESGNYNGVCLMSSKAKLNGVQINGGKHGVILGPNSSSNRILPNVEIDSSTEYGIADLSGDAGNNMVIMTNRAPWVRDEDDEIDKGKTDKDGMIFWGDEFYSMDELLGNFMDNDDPAYSSDANERKLTISGTERVIASAKDVVPLITMIDDRGPTEQVVNISGMFISIDALPGEDEDLEGEEDDGEYDAVDCSNISPSSTKPQRLAVMMVGDDGMHFINLVGRNSAKGIDEDGTFDFYIDKNKHPDLYGSNNKFVLVPLDESWEMVGRASSYKRLSDYSGDCTPGTEQGGNGPGGGAGEGELMNYQDEAACNADMEFERGYCESNLDSDGDGIPDCVEMSTIWDPTYDTDDTDPDNPLGAWVYDYSQGSCNCNGKASCWYLIDTDGDGITDNYDNGASDDWWGFLQDIDDYDADPVHVPGVKNTDREFEYDGAGDDLPNMRDDDSDDDNLPDWKEDRARTFQKAARAYYKKFNLTGSPKYYLDSNSQKVECDLEDFGSDAADIGIYWGIFKVGGSVEAGTYIDKPIEWTANYMGPEPATLNTDQVLAVMACVNETVTDINNFNGSHEKSKGETDPRNPDSDNDCVCDDIGDGCKQIDWNTSPDYGDCLDFHGNTEISSATPQWRDDGCPNTPNPTNDCVQSCIADEVIGAMKWNSIGREWLVPAPDGDAIPNEPEDDFADQLRDDGHGEDGIAGNGVPDLFEQIVTVEEKVMIDDEEVTITWTHPNYELVKNACTDIDEDGIPDCVERWETGCGSVFTSKYLSPYTKDSDGDGLLDGQGESGDKADVCPFTTPAAGQDDTFTPVNPNYSCDNPDNLVAMGKAAKILGCYVDRDGDKVIDCLEDRNMDGSISSSGASDRGNLQPIYDAESSPLNTDTDGDGIGDFIEIIEGWPIRTNPNREDTDGDGLLDNLEDRDSNVDINVTILTSMGCNPGVVSDTDPRIRDTDDDGLTDNQEVTGTIMSDDNFLALIEDPTIWGSGGIPAASSPVDKDSDGDGLLDGEEYNGLVITYYDSNPCMIDSDGDTRNDAEEERGCRLQKNENCVGVDDPDAAFGLDSDSDGLTDALEVMLGTDPRNPDTDGDGVWDGIEDANQNGIFEPSLGETNATAVDMNGDGIPDGFDTDLDGLNDGFELRYGTDPTNTDTDGDCIADGIEDENRDGQYQMGTETDARLSDTDADGLPDGWIASSGLGEDLNCNGVRDQDADGMYLETDPRNPDSDLDGIDDFTEMTHGGYFNLANLNRTTTGREGCSLAGSVGAAPSGMMLLIGLALAVARLRRKDETPA